MSLRGNASSVHWWGPGGGWCPCAGSTTVAVRVRCAIAIILTSSMLQFLTPIGIECHVDVWNQVFSYWLCVSHLRCLIGLRVCLPALLRSCIYGLNYSFFLVWLVFMVCDWIGKKVHVCHADKLAFSFAPKEEIIFYSIHVFSRMCGYSELQIIWSQHLCKLLENY